MFRENPLRVPVLTFPWETGLAEMAVVGGLTIDRLQQRQPFNDRRRPKIELLHELQRRSRIAGAERLHFDRDWLRDTDRII